MITFLIVSALLVLLALGSFIAGVFAYRNNAENALVKFALTVIDSLWAKRK